MSVIVLVSESDPDSLCKAARQLTKTKNLWDDTLFAAADKPAQYLIWLEGISWAAEIGQKESGTVIFDIVGTVRRRK